ncbi:MAG: DUF5916 domain-containing protein [Dysgonamonadaceae bacterium]|nr:DUF5916 domain-containing protein [Dysgonamonadaceae bacterium]
MHLKNLITVSISFLAILFVICSNAYGQRIVEYGQFSPTYFDSIRALVNDTAKENYTINAYRLSVSEGEIIIDGQLNELAWSKAMRRGGFLEKEPFPLVPMSEETEFAILYDDENIYLGIWCWDSEPDKIIRQLSPRGTNAPDHLMLFFDSYHDRRTGYKFVVSPTGVQADELRYDDTKRDANWNGIWYSEGSVDENGWYAEIKIPFYNFRYSRKSKQTWGFNIMRNISKDASRGQWKPHLPEWDNTTRMSKMGNIENIYNISPGRTFELRPYGVTGVNKTMDQGTTALFSVGGDIRYNPTPNLTADFTLNPDFAQVDADVFEINLTRFPTRFKELRPFFTEQINIFNTPMELFYSRRIGAKGDILGGGKATGKLPHGVEFGVLGNLTGESVFSSSVENIEKAMFGVLRIKKDIFESGNIGVIAGTKEESGNFNRVFGVDGNFMFNNDDIVDFQVASGLTEKKQTQNRAYNLTYTRTGDLWGMKFNYNRVEPAFEINRIGYIQKETDRGWNKGTALIRISPRINKHHIRKVTTHLEYIYNRDLFTTRYINTWLERHPSHIPDTKFGTIIQSDNSERIISGGARGINNYHIGGDVTVNLINEMLISTEYKYFSATEMTENYKGSLFKMHYSTRPISLGAKFAGKISALSGTFYNFDQKYVGSQRSLSVEGEGRLHRNILTKLQTDFIKTYDDNNTRDGQYFKLSSNSTWMFTKDFFIRLHAQGMFGKTYYYQKQKNNDYLLSCLISWQYRPGSFLFLAYNEGRFDGISSTESNIMKLKNRTVILKMSYFFSL